MRHAQGASRLIEFRGPDRFQTDFELSLFMTHAGPIVRIFNGVLTATPPHNLRVSTDACILSLR